MDMDIDILKKDPREIEEELRKSFAKVEKTNQELDKLSRVSPELWNREIDI